MTPRLDPNLTRLITAARKLQPLLEQIVFVGGCVTGLLVTDPAASPVRPTIDIDAIVEIASYAEYIDLESRLRQLGFSASKKIICRWTSDDLVLDLMPTNTSILGFSNRWYGPALKNATNIRVEECVIRLISAPYFIATKIVAFRNRAKNDYVASRDMEDIITVIDGRPELMEDLRHSDAELQVFLGSEFHSLLDQRDFLDALPGHLLPDAASQMRFPLVLDRMRQIAAEGESA
jgi:predicted nucleotidyltransferase